MPHRKIPTFTVDAGKKLSAIKKEFNDHYPFLKLEFFRKKHKVHGVSEKKDMIEQDQSLRQLAKSAEGQALTISPEMPVALLEQLFQQQFGVAVQVFRKSGRSWLETSMTDDWTLKRQNDQGRELSYFGETGS